MPSPPSYVIPPAGVSAAGFFSLSGVPFIDPAKPPVILADLLRASDGEQLSVLTGVHPVDAAVMEAFRLSKGTGAAVTNDGQEFRKIRKVGPSTERQLRDEASRVLAPFVERGDVSIEALESEAGTGNTGTDGGAVFVGYVNLRTGKKDKAPIGS